MGILLWQERSDLKTVVHISESEISPNAGMGRVEYYWKIAFEKKGWNFIHIGPKEIGAIRHPFLFPIKAFLKFKKLNIKPNLVIAHEPCAGFFALMGYDCVLESHGVEQRYWDIQKKTHSFSSKYNLKTRILFPLWRLFFCNYGLKKAKKLLLINQEDKAFVEKKYARSDRDILVFKNGYHAIPDEIIVPNELYHKKGFTIVFNASWIERKGIELMDKLIHTTIEKGLDVYFLLIGTGKNAGVYKSNLEPAISERVEVIEKFDSKYEPYYLSVSNLFVLPSLFEGQPLSLIQAMSQGICCVSSNICGQKDIIIHNENGYLFDCGNENEFIDVVSQLYLNPERIKMFGKNAQKSVINRTWNDTSNEVVDWLIES